MEKYKEDFCGKMREVYKAVIKRIVDTGKTEESDILFIRLYKTEIEQNTNFKEQKKCLETTINLAITICRQARNLTAIQ